MVFIEQHKILNAVTIKNTSSNESLQFCKNNTSTSNFSYAEIAILAMDMDKRLEKIQLSLIFFH